MIVREISTIKESTTINKNVKWETLKPFVVAVENSILKTIIGKPLYDAIDAAITALTITPEQQALLDFIYPLVSNFTVYEAMPQLSVMISDMGVMEHRSQEGNAAPSQMWRYNDARWSNFRMGDMYRELLYKFLQENQDDYSSWVSSPAYTTYNEYFIRDNKDYHTEIGKGENMNTFLSLLPYMKLAQEKYITSIIGLPLQEAIIDKAKDNTITGKYSVTLKYIKSTLAWFTLVEAIPLINIIIIDGVLITSYPGEKSRVYVPITKEEKEGMVLDAMDKAKTYLGLLKKYLLENASDLSEFNDTTYHNQMKAETMPDYFAGENSFGLYL